MSTTLVPLPCVDEAQFIAWDALFSEEVPVDMRTPLRRGSHFCFDCTPTYQADMLSEGRCAHPEVVFAHARDTSDPELREVGIRVPLVALD